MEQSLSARRYESRSPERPCTTIGHRGGYDAALIGVARRAASAAGRGSGIRDAALIATPIALRGHGPPAMNRAWDRKNIHLVDGWMVMLTRRRDSIMPIDSSTRMAPRATPETPAALTLKREHPPVSEFA